MSTDGDRTTLSRVLDPDPVSTLDHYQSHRGGLGLAEAVQASGRDVIATLIESGLRGRGGAGFPTGVKWRTIAEYESGIVPATVIVNAAEGEPGSFKDRWLMRTNPYRVIEGALIAAHVFGAADVVVAVKSSFTTESARLRDAVEEMRTAGWLDDVTVEIFEGPSHYLYGEETGLLEAIDGRPPFPRVTPPWRRGIIEIGTDGDLPESSATADLELGTESTESPVPPALVNNVETLCHVTTILAEGADWFRGVGTDESPGTVVCTVSGSTRRHGVAEFEMGTPLLTVLHELGGGPYKDRRYRAVLSGVANPILLEDQLATPLTHEDMQAAGTGLGATGFIAFDDRDDLVEVLHAAAHFLAVESCGQCRPCKSDGLALDRLLGTARTDDLSTDDWDRFGELRESVTEGARCYLAHQLERLTVGARALAESRRPTDPRPVVIAPIVDIVDGRAELDSAQADKLPDWSHGDEDSGQYPAERDELTTTESASPPDQVDA